MEAKEWTLERLADHYVETLSGQPNGLGQHVSPIFGISHSLLHRMHKEFGETATQAEITAAFARAKNAARQ